MSFKEKLQNEPLMEDSKQYYKRLTVVAFIVISAWWYIDSTYNKVHEEKVVDVSSTHKEKVTDISSTHKEKVTDISSTYIDKRHLAHYSLPHLVLP